MINLQNAMRACGVRLNSKVDEVADGVYRIDVPLRYKDDTWRNQFVWARTSKGITKDGRDTYYFNSRVGELTPNINLKGLLEEACYGIYSMVCILKETKEGREVDMVYVQASPIAEYCNDEMQVDWIVKEVAENADYLEKKFWGEDKH